MVGYVNQDADGLLSWVLTQSGSEIPYDSSNLLLSIILLLLLCYSSTSHACGMITRNLYSLTCMNKPIYYYY